jgi:ElaB/YqjD/DUF883 family membrane-anchored ribosome-binding protein
MAQSTYGTGTERSTEAGKDQMTRAGERAEGVANRTSEGMQEVAGNMKSALDRSIKDQPMATLAVAAVVGFVLGAIWRT